MESVPPGGGQFEKVADKETLGLRLFHRSIHRVVNTKEGERVCAYAQPGGAALLAKRNARCPVVRLGTIRHKTSIPEKLFAPDVFGGNVHPVQHVA